MRLRSIMRCLAVVVLWPVVTLAQMDNGVYATSNYIAVLARNPDPTGWIVQKGALDAGLSHDALTTNFISSPEFSSRTISVPPNTSCSAGSTQFVQCLYEAGLHREPDQGGWNFWTSQTNIVAAEGIIGSPEFASANVPALRYRTAYAVPVNAAPTGAVPSGSQILFSVHYANTYGAADIMNGQVIINGGTGWPDGNGAGCRTEK